VNAKHETQDDAQRDAQNVAAPPDSFGVKAWGLLREWSLTEGPTWVYIAKAVAAALLAMFIAMRLELPSPRTALTTVFVVMTPQSGMVLAKSFYRLIGTAVGLIAMVTFISFSQAHVLFLIATAIWISLCTAGSARNRNFRSYGFLLAGYTAALIGVSNAEAPLGAFDAAVTRMIEVSLGIICAALVSAVVFPRYSSSLLETQVRTRFSGFVEFIRAASMGKLDRGAWEKRQVGFIADVVGLEALRSYSIFEDPLSRLRSGRLSRLNSESMAASTRFHALHQLLLRAQTRYIANPDDAADESGAANVAARMGAGTGRDIERDTHSVSGAAPRQADIDTSLSPVVRTVTPLLHELAEHLSVGGRPVAQAADAEQVAKQLAAFQSRLTQHTAQRSVQQRAQQRTQDARQDGQVQSDESEQHGLASDVRADIDTAIELLERFCDDLQHYARTYASLANRTATAPRESGESSDAERRVYIPKTNAVMAALAGVRAGITLLLVSAFWIYSGWPSGDFATLTAGTICALISASPQPARAAVQMVFGSLLATVAGYIMTFHVFPHQDGYVLMAASIAPFLMFGAWLTTRRKWVPAGLAYCIFFCFLAGPDNLTNYDPVTYLNNSIALVVAMAISACAFAVFLPPTTAWVVRRVARDLRGLIRLAAFPGRSDKTARNRNRITERSHRLDHQTRDLMFQIAGLTAENPPVQRTMLQWMFSVLEIGHALIEVHGLVDRYDRRARSHPTEPHLPSADDTTEGSREVARHNVGNLASRDLAHGAWLSSVRDLREPLSALFEQPSRERWQAALGATNHAIGMTRARHTVAHGDDRSEESAHRKDSQDLLRLQRYLHFIRTALLDEASPLAAYAGTPPSAPALSGAMGTSS